MAQTDSVALNQCEEMQSNQQTIKVIGTLQQGKRRLVEEQKFYANFQAALKNQYEVGFDRNSPMWSSVGKSERPWESVDVHSFLQTYPTQMKLRDSIKRARTSTEEFFDMVRVNKKVRPNKKE